MKEQFENWLKEKYLLWTSDVKLYEDRVANFPIAPKFLKEIWLNKDQTRKVDYINGTDISAIIKNGPSNRPPNYRDISKRKQKVSYLLGAISYVRDYNQLPISLIIKESGKLQFDYLLAKDRGTFNYYLTKMDEPQSISFWKDIINMNKEYEDKSKMKEILTQIQKLINIGTEFSVREAVPQKIFNTWNEDNEMVSIRMKFETYSNHTGEMDRMNNNPNPWVLHNHIMNDTIVPMVYEYPNTYKEATLNTVYKAVCEYDLFSGKNKYCMTNIPNSSVEESEGFIPWLFHSLTFSDAKTLNDVISVFARETKSNTETLKKLYKLAFKSTNFEEEFKNSLEFLNTIANHPTIQQWVIDYKEYLDNEYPDAKKRPTNIKDITISKWDTFLSVAICIHHIQSSTNRTGSERLNNIVDKFISSAIEKLSDKKIMKELGDTNGGLTNRYELFWEKVSDTTLNKLNIADSGEFDVTELKRILKNTLQSNGMWGTSVEIYDRISSTQFEIIDISDFKNLQEGHLIPTNPIVYGNIVLQPKGDNDFNNNHPIKDIDLYIKEYMEQLNEFFENSILTSNPVIILRTQMVLNSWINQKNYIA